jgi:thiamine-phosphate pyrophosphorylase
VIAEVRLTGLYAIADTHYLAPARLAPTVAEAIAGGARVVQYRDKRHGPAARREHIAALLAVCRPAGVPLIVNDDVEAAAECGADGVHLGREDMPLENARARLGAGFLIGISCYNELARAEAAEAGGADYVAFGSFFPSATKPGAVRAPLELLAQARARLKVPIVAIGGITPENGARLLAAGADLLAAAEGVFARSDVREAARAYARLFETRARGGGEQKI